MDIEISSSLEKSFKFQNRELLDNYVSLVVSDIDGNIQHISTNLCNLFGYKSSELIDQSYDFLIKQDFLEKFREQFNDVKISRSVWKGEIKHTSKNDVTIWMDTIVKPLFDDDNKHIGFIFASHDITQEKKLKKIHEESMLKGKHSQTVLDFMPSLSSAVLLRTDRGLIKILWIIFITIIFLLFWASYFQLDEIVKGSGKIIPSNNIQTISSLEKATINEVLIKNGDSVKKGQPLIKLKNNDIITEYNQNYLSLLELLAKKARLYAEASQIDIKNNPLVMKHKKEFMIDENKLFISNKKTLTLSIKMINEKLLQKRKELEDAKKNQEYLQLNYSLLQKESSLKKKLLKEKLISKINYLQFSRELNTLKLDIKKIKDSISQYNALIQEYQQNIVETYLNYKNKARTELITVNAKIKQFEEIEKQLKNKIKNKIILSPVDGVIKKILVTTNGAIIQSGEKLLEIVPNSDYFIAELKIKPSDIAFIYVGQPVLLKLQSYDYSIYGGIDGKISYISADTIISENGEFYYIVYIKAEKEYIKYNRKITIKSGMTVEANILTGKKSILDYILKPILKGKQLALTER